MTALVHPPGTAPLGSFALRADVVRGLGRHYAPDPRDRKYPLSSTVGRGLPRVLPAKRWHLGRGLTFQSQGNTSECTHFGTTHLLMLTPIVRYDAFELTATQYAWSQRNDEWPGENYDGTSVRAALEYLRTEIKVIDRYEWADNMDVALRRLTRSAKEGGGPLTTGIDWWSGFDNEKGDGWWDVTGWLRGGHCLDLIGYEPKTAKRKEALLWGNSHEGNFVGRSSVEAAEYLLFQANGEAAAVTELARTV